MTFSATSGSVQAAMSAQVIDMSQSVPVPLPVKVDPATDT
jgi:hypothetical protein